MRIEYIATQITLGARHGVAGIAHETQVVRAKHQLYTSCKRKTALLSACATWSIRVFKQGRKKECLCRTLECGQSFIDESRTFFL